MATSKKGFSLGKKVKNVKRTQGPIPQDDDQSGICTMIDGNDKADNHQINQPEVTSKVSDIKMHATREFHSDLDNDVADSFLEHVSIDEADDIYNSFVDEPIGEIELEQPSNRDNKRLYFGRASYRNIYGSHKKQEDKNWITWETFSAISGMEVSELVRRAEVADLVLDDRGLARIRKRFTSMPKMYKRQFYRCGDRYMIPEQIPNWSDHCKKMNIPTSDFGDDSLNRKVALMHGDITTLEVDAAVNSISSYVTDKHEGVSKAIVNAASSLLLYELESIWLIYSGNVEATAGYLLPAKYIFHTSGPTTHEDDYIEGCLESCYINCLNKMVEMGLRTLAFPCIATGAKSVHPKNAAKTALTSVKTWLKENKDSVDKIIFCVYDIDNWACYQEFMPEIFPPSANKDTSEASLLPIEILRMDKNSIELYKRALSEGKEAVHNIRIMVVGHYGVGKTTLTKRLFGEDVDINTRESTNGIDVHVKRCRVSLETGQWIFSENDQNMKTASHRLVKLLTTLNDTAEMEKAVDDFDVEELLDTVDGHRSVEENDETNQMMIDINKEDSKEDTNAEISKLSQVTTVDMETNVAGKPKEEYVLNHLKDLIDEVKQKSAGDDNSNLADVSIWDFAGQYVFYATHQVFLSKRAVYLLVTDISKHVDDIVKDDDCFLDSKGARHWKISEFVDFWLNSIHEFCSSSEVDGPPVVLVGTFADKLKQESRQEISDEFFYTLRSSLLDKVTSCHLTDDDFILDNSIKDENIELLKQHVLKIASAQSYWGELLPAKWITLENIIVKLKDDGLKVLYKDKLHDLNNTLPVPIETEEQLELFLRFHHESGNILYYSDDKLSNTIVLDPQWLIDAFKSLITAKMFCCRKPNIFKKWIQFDESAILTRELVDAIWKQDDGSVFYEYEDLLLEYLAKLGFISKPRQQPDGNQVNPRQQPNGNQVKPRQQPDGNQEIDYYFAPCVLKTSPPDDLLMCTDCKNRRSTSVLCFTTTSGFLPTAVFNKLLASCIDKWPITQSKKKNLVFCGCGVFDLEDNHKLYLYFFDHIINIWIIKLSTTDEEPKPVLCKNVYDFVLDFLRNKMRLSSGIEEYIRCDHSNLRNNDNMFNIEDISEKQEVVCNAEQVHHVHRTNELTRHWPFSEPGQQVDELTEKELNRMALYIGKEYHSLGIELGLSNTEIEHICLDYKTTVDRIRGILLKWKDYNKGNATLEVLTKAMNIVGIDAVTAIEKTKEIS